MVSYRAAFNKRASGAASAAARVVSGVLVGTAGGAFPGRSTADRGEQDQEPGPKVSNAGVAGHWFCSGVRRRCEFLRHELRNAPDTARDRMPG
jgi:hypothetical protein